VPFAGQRLSRVLDDAAAPTPAPGGGSAAALVCGLGAALVGMAARIELERRPGGRVPEGAAERMRALRERALELAERELGAYAPVLEARRLAPDDPARAERLEAALLEASHTPLEVAAAAAEVAELGAEVAEASDPSVRGDAVAGVLLAEAAAAAAARLVEVNLGDRGGAAAELRERSRAARGRAASARERAGG
jgi:formiminotetrahydrofolate cyclodeaminase